MTKKRTVDQTAQSVEVKSADGKSSTLHFWLFTPKGYQPQGAPDSKKWPLMLFLHGSGERGDNLELVKVWGPSKLVAGNPNFPFVLVSPQCPAGERWNVDHLDQLLDQAISRYNVDPNRVYVTGLSMGGSGTWALAAKCPRRIAAAIPICGGGDPETAAALIDVPIWVFHGEADSVVDIEESRKMMSAVLAVGGKKIRITTYAGVDHNSWTATYANPQIYEWLLSNQLKK